MKIDLKAYEKAFSKLPEKVKEAEVCADLREELLISVLGGEQDSAENFSRTTLYLRTTAEKTGTVLTEKLDEDPYALMEKALAGASCSQSEETEPMNVGENFCKISGDDSAAVSDIRKAACELEKAALSTVGLSAVRECALRKSTFARRVINSKGLDRYQEHSAYLASLTVTVNGTEIKVEEYVPSLNELNFHELALSALRKAEEYGSSLPKIDLPSGAYPTILSSTVVRNMMIAIWQTFSGERLLNGTSAFANTDKEIGASCLNIVDDPLPENWSVDYSLDSQGTVCKKKYIVKDGKLIQPLHTLTSAAASHSLPSGNAGRVASLSGSTPIAAIAVPSCIYVESGDKSPDELIAMMGDGVYLTYSLDVFHSINIASGEFSIPCGGIVYKKGKAIGKVEQLTIAGNLRDLFRNILAVGKDLALEEFMFYHNYSYGGPSILIKELSYSGKA